MDERIPFACLQVVKQIPISHCRIASTFNVPTEVVVLKPKIVAPRQGRIYTTSLYIQNGDVVERENVVGPRLANNSLYWIELWEDYSSDGHTEYELTGYALMTAAEADRFRMHMETSKDWRAIDALVYDIGYAQESV